MGAECLNGHNKDIDLSDKSSRVKTIDYSSQARYEDYGQHSFRNINESYHYQTHFQDYNRNEIYHESVPNNRKKNLKKFEIKPRSNSLKLINNGKQKNIQNFSYAELQDQVNDILRIRIPFFENNILKALSSFTFLSGNGPYHEGLMFFTTNKNFYIAQSYPITFIKVSDFNKGILNIVSFNNINKNSRVYRISEIYVPQEPITLSDILNIINDLPNKYNLINDNCQNFCNNIINTLNINFKMEKDELPNPTKINFLKNQRNIKVYNNIPHNKFSNNSTRFAHLSYGGNYHI